MGNSSSRKKKLVLNTSYSLIYEVVTVIYGLILPRLILEHYGSGINGLTNSINQFLHVISFLNFGIGAVVQSALYKPLAEKNEDEISRILKSGHNFYKKLSIGLLIYVLLLIALYPSRIDDYDYLFTATLIAVISISSFAEYLIGVTDGLLLSADQRGYIQIITRIISQIVNVILCVFLVNNGFGIIAVKLTTSIVFAVRPFIQRFYIGRHYNITRTIKLEGEPLSQKWNGVAQHIAAAILESTDTVVLTLFSTLKNVSIYSVYYLVIRSIKQLVFSAMGGLQSLLGELWAKEEKNTLKRTFAKSEWSIHTFVTILFGCVASLICPFVIVYTNNISDANYNVPIFGFILSLAYCMYSYSLVYNIMILAANQYKQTQWYYVVASIINLSVSILVVSRYGLIGVAIGTLIAMIFQLVWMAIYVYKKLLGESLKRVVQQILADIIVIVIAFSLSQKLSLRSISYIEWVVMAVKVTCIWLLSSLLVNIAIFRQNTCGLLNKLFLFIHRKSRI